MSEPLPITSGGETSPKKESFTGMDANTTLWKTIRYFKSSEFDDPSSPGSGLMMNIEFVRILDSIRSDVGFIMPINSGIRTKEHNTAIGGKQNSAHLIGCAADIGCIDSDRRLDIVRSALRHGINRIGIGSNFIHLDIAFNLPQNVMWLYPEKATALNQAPT